MGKATVLQTVAWRAALGSVSCLVISWILTCEWAMQGNARSAGTAMECGLEENISLLNSQTLQTVHWATFPSHSSWSWA
jgi:hypothetical protein